MKGRSRGVCRQKAEGRGAWHRVGRLKKYKSGAINLKNFSWNEPTKENGGSTCICTAMCWKTLKSCAIGKKLSFTHPFIYQLTYPHKQDKKTTYPKTTTNILCYPFMVSNGYTLSCKHMIFLCYSLFACFYRYIASKFKPLSQNQALQLS